jgi:SAM-dependent methyltransferase
MKPEELHNIHAAEQQFWWYRGMRAITDAMLAAAEAPSGGVGLDAGCGTGFNALVFERRHGFRMFGVDLAPLAVEYCRQHDFRRSCAASITALPFGDAAFDLITSFDVLSHLPAGEEKRALTECVRVLRPGGWLIVRVPAFRALRSRHSAFIAEHQRFRAGCMLRLLSEHPLRVVRWSYANSFLSPIAFVKFRCVEPLLGNPPSSGVESMPPIWLNGLLTQVLRCEATLIRWGLRFAFGQSVIMVAQKTASAQNT